MIKSLSYEQLNEIEGHFLFAREERLMVAEITEAIAEATSYEIDPTGIHGTKITDATASKAHLIDKKTAELRRWGEVVKETFAHFKNDVLMINLLNLLYVEKIGPEAIMNKLYISKTSLYEYRKEILRYGALRAVSKGIFEV